MIEIYRIKFPIDSKLLIKNNFSIDQIQFLHGINIDKPGFIEIPDVALLPTETLIIRALNRVEDIINVISYASRIGIEIDRYNMTQTPMVVNPGDSFIIGHRTFYEVDIKRQKIYNRLYINFRDLIPEGPEKEHLKFSLNFYRKGLFAEDILEKFLYFWIVLESLFGGRIRAFDDDYRTIRDVINNSLNGEDLRDNPYRTLILNRLDECIYENISRQLSYNIRNFYLEIFNVDLISDVVSNQDALFEKIRNIQRLRSNLVHGTRAAGAELNEEIKFIHGIIKNRLTNKLEIIYSNFENNFPNLDLLNQARDFRYYYTHTDRRIIGYINCIFSHFDEAIDQDRLFYLLFPFIKDYIALERLFSDNIPSYVEHGLLDQVEREGRIVYSKGSRFNEIIESINHE